MYERQIATVRRLIKKYGEQSVIRRYTEGGEVTPGRPGPNIGEPSQFIVSCVYLPPDSNSLRTLQYGQASEVPTGVELCFMEPPLDGSEVVLTDELYRAGDTGFVSPVKIIKLDRLAPNGVEPVLYTLWVTR